MTEIDFKKVFDRVMIELYIAGSKPYMVTRTDADRKLMNLEYSNKHCEMFADNRQHWCVKGKIYVVTKDNVNVKRQIFEGKVLRFFGHQKDVPSLYPYDADCYISEL
jgi:hypothetical protein